MASTRNPHIFCLTQRRADVWRSLGRQFTIVATFGRTVLVQLAKE